MRVPNPRPTVMEWRDAYIAAVQSDDLLDATASALANKFAAERYKREMEVYNSITKMSATSED